jgi:hypothetical protein
MRLALTVCAAIWIFIPSGSRAQSNDLSQKVSDLLTNYGPVPVTKAVSVPHTQNVCTTKTTCMSHGGPCNDHTTCQNETTYTSQNQTSNAVLTASNIRISQTGTVSWGASTVTSLPTTVYTDTSGAQNCLNAAQPLSHTFALAVAYSRTATLQLLQSVTHTQTYTVSLDSGDLLPFKVSAQVALGEQQAKSTTTIDSAQTTVTRTDSATISVNAGATSYIQLRVWPVEYSLPFNVSVTVDADLSPNDKGFKLLSDAIPDPVARTFVVSGLIRADDASAGQTIQLSVPYDPAPCAAAGGSYVTEHIVPKPQIKMTNLKKIKVDQQ